MHSLDITVTPPRVQAPPALESPERTLETLLAAIPNDPGRAEQLCGQVKGWRAVLEWAGRHGVESVVYRYVHALGSVLPREVEAHVEQQLAFERLAQSRLVEASEEALGKLEAEDVAVVVLKGPVLAERLYGDGASRPSSDLDFLVAPSELDRAVEALRSIGYEADRPRWEPYYRKHHHHLHLHRAHTPPLELHFRLTSSFGTVIPPGDFVARAELFRTANGTVTRVLSAEDELLYLCLHAAAHYYRRLGWLYELKLFLRKYPSLDWPAVWARARQYRVTAALSFTLEILRSRLGAAVPETEDVLPANGLRFGLTKLSLGAAGIDSSLFGLPGRLAFHSLLCDGPGRAFRLLYHRLVWGPWLWLRG